MTRSAPFQNVLPWGSFNDAPVVQLVSLTRDRGVFDFCDLTAYNLDRAAPLLKLHKIDFSKPWMAVLFNKANDPYIFEICNPYVSWDDGYTLLHLHAFSIEIHNMGSIGKKKFSI